MRKEASTPKSASPKIKNASNNSTALTPRMERLLLALLEEPQSIATLQKKIPANNVPEYVRQLRWTFGLSIPCERIPFVTSDGRKSSYGIYELTPRDRAKANKLLLVK